MKTALFTSQQFLDKSFYQSLLELRATLDAKIAALEAVVSPPQENENRKDLLSASVSEEGGEEEEGEDSQMEKRISQNA